jgi:hypothetical protein
MIGKLAHAHAEVVQKAQRRRVDQAQNSSPYRKQRSRMFAKMILGLLQTQCCLHHLLRSGKNVTQTNLANDTKHTLKAATARETTSVEEGCRSRRRMGKVDKTFSITASWLCGTKGSTPLRWERQRGHGNPKKRT